MPPRRSLRRVGSNARRGAEDGRGAVGRSRTALRDHQYHRDAPSEFKCCAGTTAPGLRLRRTVSSVYETRLKQSACRMAVGSVRTKCPPAAFPPTPALGVDLLEDHPALQKGRWPAAFFFCGRRNCTFLFPCATCSPRRNRIAIRSERVRWQCPFLTRARLNWRFRAQRGIGCPQK
jgi:hypothetical protein